MLTRIAEKEQRRRAKLSSAMNSAVVIVTGASSGIGAATAREFARHGAQVILAARRIDELAAQQQTITGEGHLAFAIPTDITDAAQITKLVDQTIERFGRVIVHSQPSPTRSPGWLILRCPEDNNSFVCCVVWRDIMTLRYYHSALGLVLYAELR